MLGAVVGLAAFSRFLSWLLGKYHSQTISVLIGFLIGSLFVIWPYQNREFVEQVRETVEIDYTSERAQELLNSEVNENLPEYERVGKIINPESSFDEFKKIEVETVKKKMIKSKPFVPGISENSNPDTNVWGGVIGILIGMMMVGGLDYLREKS